MPACAPRVSRRLIEATIRFDDRSVPIAEVWRRVGAEADRLGLTRPSYQRVRTLVHASRRVRRGTTTTSILVDIAARSRPPDAFLEHISGVGVPELR